MARKSSAFTLSRIVATRRENLANARRELADLQAHAAEFRAALHVVNMVADYAAEIDFTKWSSVSTYMFDTPELCVNLEGTVSSLKQGPIVDIIDRAMACGFEPVGSTDYLNDWASQRTFKFNNCMHISEPGCAVRKAVSEHRISQSRYNSYLGIFNSVVIGKNISGEGDCLGKD